MRGMLTIPLIAALAVGCGAPTEAPPLQALAGVWLLDSATAGLPPRQMTLSQTGTSVSGTGTAMGVDAPIPITITGTYSPAVADRAPLVTLHLSIADGGGTTADFTGTLAPQGVLRGTVVYAGNVFSPGPMFFVRPQTTGLKGIVTRGPVTPVCQVGVPCDAPFAAPFSVLAGQVVVARFSSDAAGFYEVLLAPGSYEVVADSTAPVWPRGQPHPVTVEPLGLTHLDLQFDTGIR